MSAPVQMTRAISRDSIHIHRQGTGGRELDGVTRTSWGDEGGIEGSGSCEEFNIAPIRSNIGSSSGPMFFISKKAGRCAYRRYARYRASLGLTRLKGVHLCPLKQLLLRH